MKTYEETIVGMIAEQTNRVARIKSDIKDAETKISELRKNSKQRPVLEDILASLDYKLRNEEEKLAQMEKFRNEIGAIEDVETRIAGLQAERESIYKRIGDYATLIFCTLRSERNN